MALLLSIETATPVCSLALSDGPDVLGIRETSEKNSHSQVVTVFIDELLRECGLQPQDLDAVAVSRGPGSYTGLRIGVSTAKGLCYALDKPLIAVDTLEAMAYGMARMADENAALPLLFAPMIDARRMEVYTAIFDAQGKNVREIQAEIIDAGSFAAFREQHIICLAGDGAGKCRQVLMHPNICYLDQFSVSARYMAPLAYERFRKGLFEDTAYFEPYYLKDFVAGVPKVKGLREE